MSKPSEEFDLFEIDKFRLDDEWVNQVRWYGNYAMKLAEAKAAYEQSKSKLEITIAELDRDIRSVPIKYGITKKTDTAVERTIPLQDKYKEDNQGMLKAKHAMDVLQAQINTLEQRKRSISDLVQLTIHELVGSSDNVPLPKGIGRGRERK